MPTNAMITDIGKGPLVLVSQQNGITVIPQPTPLTRLNYFDGKFLRAADLSTEQRYLRRLVALSNQAGGPGVAYGYNLSLAAGGDTLNVGPGLAIDPEGRALLLPQALSIGVQELIEQSRQLKRLPAAAPGSNGTFADCTAVAETPPSVVVEAGTLYLITIGFAEALCGQEDVFGKLCEEACATSTDRPYLVEGVVLRAIPLQLQTPLPVSAVVALSQLHLRSRVAAAYFEDERRRIASFISGDGLRSDVWCFGADAAGGLDVPIGVIARAGDTTLFLDAWIARRERIDPPAKRYWQWRMAMRPWDVYLAHILQFQCQLSYLFKTTPPVGGGADDPCARERGVLRDAAERVAKIASFYETVTKRFTLQPLLVSEGAGAEKPPELEGGLTALLDFHKRLQAVKAAIFAPSDKVLIDGGIIETPSAAYLPVIPSSVASVNEQVRRLMGKGVDLRFCIVRPDFVAHALEEAQHMERISLLEGLNDRTRKPEVDILVPNGEAIEQKPVAGAAYEAEFRAGNPPAGRLFARSALRGGVAPMRGAAHIEIPESGPVQLFTAVDRDASQPTGADKVTGQSLWGAVTCGLNPFTARFGEQAGLETRIVLASEASGQIAASDVLMNGTVTIDHSTTTGTQRTVSGRFFGQFSILAKGETGRDRTIPRRLTLELTAVLSTPDGAAPSLQLTFRAAKLAIEVSASWSGSPRRITFALEGGKQPLFNATFTQNEGVLDPANGLHLAALAALDKIGKAFADPQFPPNSAAMLFPPPPPPTEDLQIRAVLDWVLFHRRRSKQCQPERPAVVIIPARRYQLWHGLVARREVLARTTEALENNKEFDREGVAFQQVDVVEFAPGVPTLISPADAVRTDWGKVKPGNILLYGAIASGDAAKQEGPLLAEGRLGAVVQAVAPISAPDASFSTKVLADIHPDLAVPDLDGSIVLLTMLQTTCVTVVGIKPGTIERVRDAVGRGDIAEALEFRLIEAEVKFTSGTDNVQDNSLQPVVDKWSTQQLQKDLGLPPLIAWHDGDANVPEAIAMLQGQSIQRALPPPNPAGLPTPELVRSPRPLPLPGCPVILFVPTSAPIP